MLESVQDAWKLIEDLIPPAAAIPTALREAAGLVLAERVVATGDSPPFDKALMDGYAIRACDYAAGVRDFHVVAELTAGQIADRALESGTAIRIMTGTQLPAGCDCVVPVEMTRSSDNVVTIAETSKAFAEANLARRGQALRSGDQVLPAGCLLGPAQLGALAEMGVFEVSAIPRPTVSIVATGDELVAVHETPLPGQIRNSNELMLATQVQLAGGVVEFAAIARDNPSSLQAAIQQGLQSDFLVLSGGVSAGVLDLVPAALRDCGAEQVFHGCNVKPGKPIWFGQVAAGKAADGRPRWIFGLPGNPVSSMVCFELFVRTALHRRRGFSPSRPVMQAARLAVPHVSRDSRPTYFPAVISQVDSGLEVCPLNWQGSFDLQTVALANAFVLFEKAGERAAGQEVQTLRLDR